ncbi:MAG: hypothetical protein HZA29_00430 [Candidatus Omnitrophica bacterium]|nr:hypothetical protein [Candidatus Omnitrophota bacterium]
MNARILSLVLCAGPLFFCPPASAHVVFTFHGQVDFSRKQLDVVLDFLPPPESGPPANPADNHPSTVAVSAARTSPGDYRLSLDIEHLRTPLFDLLSKIEGSFEIVPPRVKGRIWSRDSLVDYRPIRELAGQFEIKDNRLFLNDLSVANLNCAGTLDMRYPYKMDLTVKLQDMAMKDFLDFWVRGNGYDSSGSVSGELGISGTPERLNLKGSLESYNGTIEQLAYNTIHLNAEGIYPDMRILDSTLSKADGVSVNFSGPFDLSDQENFQKQISALVFAPIVSGSLTQREWTIKRTRQAGAGSTEIKYLLRKDDRISGGSDMLGVQQRMDF